MDNLRDTETAEERRRRHLNELIEMEGGPKRSVGRPPGHYVIADKVHIYEGSSEDSKQMAQALRQIAVGKRNMGHATARRIEAAYDGSLGVGKGWFDQPIVSTLTPTTVLDQDEDDATGSSEKTIRDFVIELALALPSAYAPCLNQTETFRFSKAPTLFAYRSKTLAVLPVVWKNPPSIESTEYPVQLYPSSVFRAVLKLAAWNIAEAQHRGGNAEEPKCIVAVIDGATPKRHAPLEVYFQAKTVGVEIIHVGSAKSLAGYLQVMDPISRKLLD